MPRQQPDPLVVRQMREFQRRLAAREARQMAEMARRWIGVQDHLETTINKLAKDIAAKRVAGQDVTRAALWRMERYQDLLLQTRREIARYVDGYAVGAVRAEQLRLIDLAAEHFVAEARTQIGLTLTRLPVEAVRNMVGLAGDGSPLRDLLMKSWPTAVDGLTQKLIDATALGWNPNKTARAMREGIDEGLERMIGIARSEQIRVYRQADYQAALDTGMVTGMQRLAARQERTCLACLLDYGHVYPIEMQPGDHVLGRCKFVKVWMGRAADTWLSGREWFEGLDEDAQRRIMGTGRWQAWKDGTVKLDDMVRQTNDPTWGHSIGVKPLGNGR
jgi:hypothetical protein